MADTRHDALATVSSFSGADLVVNFHTTVIAELQQISWNISREKAPVYSLGSADPRSFSRGKRGIAGSLVFSYYNRDGLIEAMTEDTVWNSLAPRTMWTARGNLAGSRTGEDFESLVDLTTWGSIDDREQGTAGGHPESRIAREGEGDVIYSPANFDAITKDTILYADQLPPFDITLTFANEYGQAAFAKVYYVDIMNDSGGVSIDSMITERPMTWIARRMSPIVQGVHDGGQNIIGRNVLGTANGAGSSQQPTTE